MIQQDLNAWLNEMCGCLQDMGASAYDGDRAERFFAEGYSPADAAAELMNDEEDE